MLLLPDHLQITAFILFVEFSVGFKGVCILTGSIEGCGQSLPQVLDQPLKVMVIIEHGGQAGTLSTGLFLKLAVDDGSVQKEENIK